jgi:hypothetical protein
MSLLGVSPATVAMPRLPAEFTAVVSGDGALVPPPNVRAVLVPGAHVIVRLAGEAGTRAFPPTTLDEIAGVIRYDGPPIPVEKLSIEAYEYRDLYPDDDVTLPR